MKQKLSRLLSLFVVIFTTCLPTMAGNYSKVVTKAVGEGKVYVGTSTTGSPAYEEVSESATKNSSDKNHTYHLYAQANEGYEFIGWYDNENCEGEAISEESHHQVTIKGAGENDYVPVTYYAKFSGPVFVLLSEHVYLNIDATPIANMIVEDVNATYVSSNTNVITIDEGGLLHPVSNGTAKITASAQGFDDITYLVTVIDNVSAGVTQIGNGDFEDWRNVTSSNHAPSNWNSFETAEGGFASMINKQQVEMVEGGRPGSNGLYCVKIYSRDVSLAIAQGNLTVGCINAGAMTAANKGNHNFSKITDNTKSETISKVPSAIKAWVKFVPGATNANYPNARVSATVHDAYNYITYGQASDDTDENKAHAIAQAELNFPACDWTEITVPFVPTGNTTDDQMYIVVNFTTNAVPGEGQEGDYLYIDDVELVYPDEPEPVIYNKHIVVTVDGDKLEPEVAPIEVLYNDDNTIDFSLNNFCLLGGGVGNITLPNLTIDEDGNFSFNGTIKITAGNKEGIDTWIGPDLGDIPTVLKGTIKDDYFYVYIDINVGYPVEVEVGDLANATVSISDALVTTFCAPFAVTIPADYQSFVTASTVTGINGRLLILEPVSDYVIPANTPVVIQTPVAAQLPVSGIFVKDTPVAGLLTGVYENTPAPVGSYVLQNLNGKVGFYLVAEGKQPTLGANRCYLTVPASGVKAFYLDGDDATGISNVDANVDANEVIYNIAGQRINELQKGINIVNGKKILK